MTSIRWQHMVCTTALPACLLLGACSSPMPTGRSHNPQVMTDGVDMKKFEADQAACAQTAAQAGSNYEPTHILLLRTCLIDKGYRLLN